MTDNIKVMDSTNVVDDVKLTEKDVAFNLHVVRTGFLSTLFVLILITMTIDRAAFVWLSLKYKMTNEGTALLLSSLFLKKKVCLFLRENKFVLSIK